jgi:hypothetical protein
VEGSADLITLPNLWFWEPTWQENLCRSGGKIKLPWWISVVREEVVLADGQKVWMGRYRKGWAIFSEELRLLE